MVEKTVTLDLDSTLVASVEAYAVQHNTSLRQLVIEYLRALVTTDRPAPEATHGPQPDSAGPPTTNRDCRPARPRELPARCRSCAC